MSQSVLIRVDKNLQKEIQEIIEEREKKGLTKLSYRKITSLIPRHKYWDKVKADRIKEDIINYEGYEDE
tara:strand:+ start:398 stop:604 length:207 start_codon:yes stop_codon:yes gene_type:complete